MNEVRFHGRGGQGVVTTSKILASAFSATGQFGASFPMFGFERRGAPVTAFGRFSDKPVREKTQIYEPDILVVLDPSQKDSPTIFEGLVKNSTIAIVIDIREVCALNEQVRIRHWIERTTSRVAYLHHSGAIEVSA